MYNYSECIAPIIEKIKHQGIELAQMADKIVGQSLEKDDLYFLSAIDRAIRLLDGFLIMIEGKNLTCAGALLRLQIDNCLRVYAPYVAADKDAVFTTIIYEDKTVRALKDDTGEKMTDAQLVKRLSEKHPKIKETYSQCSGFVHLSDVAFYQTVTDVNESSISLSIGGDLPTRYDETLLSCAEAYLHFNKILMELLQPVVEAKKKFDIQAD